MNPKENHCKWFNEHKILLLSYLALIGMDLTAKYPQFMSFLVGQNDLRKEIPLNHVFIKCLWKIGLILSFSEISGKISTEIPPFFPTISIWKWSIDFINHCFHIIRLIEVTYAELNSSWKLWKHWIFKICPCFSYAGKSFS